MAINTYVCPNGHWWKQHGGKVAKCICGTMVQKGKADA